VSVCTASRVALCMDFTGGVIVICDVIRSLRALHSSYINIQSRIRILVYTPVCRSLRVSRVPFVCVYSELAQLGWLSGFF
jgi:hypothetical protein